MYIIKYKIHTKLYESIETFDELMNQNYSLYISISKTLIH